MEDNKFPSILRKLRKERNLSQTELAEKIGTNLDTVYSWEKGIRNPRASAIRKLTEFFGVTEDYLLGRVPFRYVEPKVEDAFWLEGMMEEDERFANMMASLSIEGKLVVYDRITSIFLADKESNKLTDPGYELKPIKKD